MEQEPNKRLLTSDCGSFASLRLTKGPDGTQILEIRFTWLQEDGNDKVHGWKEDVRIPYEPFRAFAGAGEDMDGAEWRQLSIPELVTRRYEFHCRKKLQEVTGYQLLLHKLGKILEQHFRWRSTEKSLPMMMANRIASSFKNIQFMDPKSVVGSFYMVRRNSRSSNIMSIHKLH